MLLFLRLPQRELLEQSHPFGFVTFTREAENSGHREEKPRFGPRSGSGRMHKTLFSSRFSRFSLRFNSVRNRTSHLCLAIQRFMARFVRFSHRFMSKTSVATICIGGSFPFSWKAAIKRTLHKASIGPICRLDSWRLSLSMPEGTTVEPPYSLKQTEEFNIDEGLEVEGELPEKVICYEGVFYNYFSIGMDAQVAYGFHHLRNEKPYLAQGPIANKIIYSGYTCTQGWFLTPYKSDPGLRGLKNILRMHVKKVNGSEWEQVPVPSSVRAVVALNLHSYGSGRNPWGNLKPEYLEKRGFVEAQVDDGLLEIFGLKQGWHASFVMVELISAKHIAQAAAIRLEVRGGEWKDAYMQMDGEPWKQPMSKDFSTFVEIRREPFRSLMISGE